MTKSRMVRVGRVVLVLAALAVTIQQFVVIDSRSHSASDALISWVPNMVVVWGLAGLASFLANRLVADRPG